jgi:FkbM family methyltransferase
MEELPLTLRLKSNFVGTQRMRHPELMQLYMEGRNMPQVAKAILHPNSFGADVGAHIGSFLSLLERFAPFGNHIAVEPSYGKCALLRRRFPAARIEQCAVSDYSGTSWFREDKDNPGFSRLSDEESSYKVEVRRLDDFNITHIDLMKFDIEGNEMCAFIGAEKLLSRCRPVIIFEAGTEYEKNEKTRIFDYLTNKMSYQIMTCADFLAERKTLTFNEFRDCGIYPFRALNFVGLP